MNLSASNWLRAPAAAGVFVAALLLVGCATPQVTRLAESAEAALPQTAQIANVPFFPQEEYQCGPAALAMVAQHAGVSVLPDDLTNQVFLPGRQGSLQVEMLAASRRQGLLAYPLAPQLSDLLREVAAGNPVLVLQNLTFSFSPLWHYAVVTGYDRSKNTITLHSGVTETLVMSLFTFERTWARGAYWSMVALPPSRLPATAQADAFAVASAALERAKPDAAQIAWRTALGKWPDQRAALLGLGNTAYAQGNLPQAASAFETATARHPDFADAWNNLAQVRLEQGRLQDANVAIERAIALGGTRAERYRQLQAGIRLKMQPQ
ncbi:MAG: PA2778 family cysteine peptidase [Pseudomonadota bacterium]